MGGNEEINMLEIKWDAQLREVSARVDDMDVFAGRRRFLSHMECAEFATKPITEGQFQWFVEIVGYLHVFTGETVSTTELQRYEVHATKVQKKTIYCYL